jgi:ATP-dependent RNA/DNA helicase IGHMBP2
MSAEILSKCEQFRDAIMLERGEEEEACCKLLADSTTTELESKGVLLRRLRCDSVRVALGGRIVVRFCDQNGSKLCSHSLSTGSVVAVVPHAIFGDFKRAIKHRMDAEKQKNTLARKHAKSKDDDDVDDGKSSIVESLKSMADSGVVSQVRWNSISVAFGMLPQTLQRSSSKGSSSQSSSWKDERSFVLIELVDDYTYASLLKTIAQFADRSDERLPRVLFGIDAPKFDRQVPDTLSFSNEALNAEQRDAVRFAMSARDVAILHGPPGTGKTSTIVELIVQLTRAGMRVLAVAPSNIAVDNIVERLMECQGVDGLLVRVGHPARLLPGVLKTSLDALVDARKDIVNEMRAEIQALETALWRGGISSLAKRDRKHVEEALRQRRAVSGGGGDASDWHLMRTELRVLRKELRVRERALVGDTLQRCSVVAATTTMCTARAIATMTSDFDYVIIDEAAQALEVAAWSPLLRAATNGHGTLVLAGDHCQLPATIKSRRAAKVLSVSLMERLVASLGDRVTRRLSVQYRMHTTVMNATNSLLYDGALRADLSVASHLLCEMRDVERNEYTESPLVFVDTAGCQCEERESSTSESKSNPAEAALVVGHVLALIEAGVEPIDIAVIAPYNAQVELIAAQLSERYPAIEIGSVDSMQGREKEAIVFSFVRSNPRRRVGFLSERRRLNVAITRARRHIALFGDSETLRSNAFMSSLCSYFEANGLCLCALELGSSIDIPDDNRVIAASSSSSSSSSQVVQQQHRQSRKAVAAEAAVATGAAVTTTPMEKKPDDNDDEKEEEEEEDRQRMIVERLSRDEERARRREELRAELDAFVANDDAAEKRFDATLNAFERLIAHELCDAADAELTHESAGVGKARHLVVRKKQVKKAPKPKKIASSSNAQPKPKPTAKAKPKAKAKTQARSTDGFDEAIASAAAKKAKPAGLCARGRCRTKVRILGADCPFCKRRFCLGHVQAEGHGCGGAAKNLARKQWKDQHDPHKASQRRSIASDPKKREQAEQRLRDKIASGEANRRGRGRGRGRKK